MRNLNVRIGEHIVISPFIEKQVKHKNSPAALHLLLCNHSAFYDDFNVCEQKVLTEAERDLHRHHYTYSTGLNSKIFVRNSFVFNSCYVILIE